MLRPMKDSGVEWIGEIPSIWDVRKIKTLADKTQANSFIDGDWIESPYIEDSGIRYLTTGNVGDGKYKEQGDGYISANTFAELNCKYAYPGDLIISRLNAPYGRSCILPANFNEYVVAVDNVILRTLHNREYICYVTQCDGYHHSIEDEAKGTTMKRISRTNLGNIQIPLPPLVEQQRIADFLNSECAKIDSVIEKTKATIEEYKALKQSIITEAVTKGIRGDRPMKDSGINWVKQLPVDWESINPKALFEQRKNKAIPGERQLTASQQYGVIYQDEYMELTGTRVVTVEKDFDILKHVEAGDFVISMRSFQGGLEYSENTGCISSAYVMLVPNLHMVFPRYYRWLLKSPLYINALQSTSNMVRDGQAMRYSNFAQVRLFKVPLDEQTEIANYLDEKCARIDGLISKKEDLVSELESYKKSLIYEYVTGKKEVKA